MDLLYTFWEKTNQQKNKLHSVPLKKKKMYTIKSPTQVRTTDWSLRRTKYLILLQEVFITEGTFSRFPDSLEKVADWDLGASSKFS